MSGNKELTLEEIHTATLGIMDYIHKFCEDNDIKYFLAYGTLIGAVRHKGFIPWDDDFDIIMLREDYDKFCELMEQDGNENFALVCRKNNAKYANGIPRVIDKRYRYVSTNPLAEENAQQLGLFIDVYPFDRFCSSDNDAKSLVKRIKTINALYSVYINKRTDKNVIYKTIRLALHYILRAVWGKEYNKKVDRRIEEVINKSKTTDKKYVGQVTWETSARRFRREWFAERQLLEFEDRKYWGPKEFDKILRVSYGDYMKLPPEEKRHPYHNYKIFKI